MDVLLLATYELGRQPFGLASPAAFLRDAGHHVTAVDLSRDTLAAPTVRGAQLIALYLSMHTATRLAAKLIPKLRDANPNAHLCCYGLYAPLNEAYLRSLGVHTILGPECEPALTALASGQAPPPQGRVPFRVPDRSGLPPLTRYARIDVAGQQRLTGYTEATRGCKHLCRHCPIVPVYQGRFHAVDRGVVLADIAQQVESGARHITFGDPDFFNGPTHAERIVNELAARWPGLSYDVTIKVEHLLRHRGLLPTLARTGCLWITSAVESLDDTVLNHLRKGHTRAGFLEAATLVRDAGLVLSPTFIPFTPWTTAAAYRDLLTTLHRLGLVENVAPIQLALRLLIPANSPLLELDDIRNAVTTFDPASLVHRWRHPDPAIDELAARLLDLVGLRQSQSATRPELFAHIWRIAGLGEPPPLPARATIPYLTEPWYC